MYSAAWQHGKGRPIECSRNDISCTSFKTGRAFCTAADMPPRRPHARKTHTANALPGIFMAKFLRQAPCGTDSGRATYLAKHLNIILAIPQPGRL